MADLPLSDSAKENDQVAWDWSEAKKCKFKNDIICNPRSNFEKPFVEMILS